MQPFPVINLVKTRREEASISISPLRPGTKILRQGIPRNGREGESLDE